MNHVPYLISKTQEDQVGQGRQNQRDGDLPLPIDLAEIKVTFVLLNDPLHYEKKLTKNIRQTDILQIYTSL